MGISMAAGGIMQDTFFSGNETVTVKRIHSKNKTNSQHKDSPAIVVNQHGIKTNSSGNPGKSIEITASGVTVHDNTESQIESEMNAKAAALTAAEAEVKSQTESIPPIANDDEPDESHEISSYKHSPPWFMNFVMLLMFGLFAMKALMGGKVRAEEKAKEANALAEREALLRQVSEAQMQMMQAQVEPHFLFNTLASVEYLIETDPPRAAAMQRSLISYLRAVLPQMRENAAKTNLGREADMVKSYLHLLKCAWKSV